MSGKYINGSSWKLGQSEKNTICVLFILKRPVPPKFLLSDGTCRQFFTGACVNTLIRVGVRQFPRMSRVAASWTSVVNQPRRPTTGVPKVQPLSLHIKTKPFVVNCRCQIGIVRCTYSKPFRSELKIPCRQILPTPPLVSHRAKNVHS